MHTDFWVQRVGTEGRNYRINVAQTSYHRLTILKLKWTDNTFNQFTKIKSIILQERLIFNLPGVKLIRKF